MPIHNHRELSILKKRRETIGGSGHRDHACFLFATTDSSSSQRRSATGTDRARGAPRRGLPKNGPQLLPATHQPVHNEKPNLSSEAIMRGHECGIHRSLLTHVLDVAKDGDDEPVRRRDRDRDVHVVAVHDFLGGVVDVCTPAPSTHQRETTRGKV